jgi:DNA-binding NarL/FixJ family response regulator
MTPVVLLADDHALLRGAVRADLEDHGYTICAEAGDAAGAVDAALRERPDIALLDVRMPGGGIEAARAISTAVPGTRVVMLTVSRNDADVRAAVAAGAVGYLLKDLPADRLAAALQDVLAGEHVLPADLH